MTQQMNVVRLPEPGFPMLTRVVAHRPHEDGVLTWQIGQPHPLDGGAKVVRMFVDRSGVTVYVTAKGENGETMFLRNFIPMSQVRLVEEMMPVDAFVDELSVSEAGEPRFIDTVLSRDEESADGDDEPEVTPASANSQVS